MATNVFSNPGTSPHEMQRQLQQLLAPTGQAFNSELLFRISPTLPSTVYIANRSLLRKIRVDAHATSKEVFLFKLPGDGRCAYWLEVVQRFLLTGSFDEILLHPYATACITMDQRNGNLLRPTKWVYPAKLVEYLKTSCGTVGSMLVHTPALDTSPSSWDYDSLTGTAKCRLQPGGGHPMCTINHGKHFDLLLVIDIKTAETAGRDTLLTLFNKRFGGDLCNEALPILLDVAHDVDAIAVMLDRMATVMSVCVPF